MSGTTFQWVNNRLPFLNDFLEQMFAYFYEWAMTIKVLWNEFSLEKSGKRSVTFAYGHWFL